MVLNFWLIILIYKVEMIWVFMGKFLMIWNLGIILWFLNKLLIVLFGFEKCICLLFIIFDFWEVDSFLGSNWNFLSNLFLLRFDFFFNSLSRFFRLVSRFCLYFVNLIVVGNVFLKK